MLGQKYLLKCLFITREQPNMENHCQGSFFLSANVWFFRSKPWNVELFLTKGPVRRIYIFSILGNQVKWKTLTAEAWYDHSQAKCLWPRHWCLCMSLCCLATDWTHVISSVNLPFGLNALSLQTFSRDWGNQPSEVPLSRACLEKRPYSKAFFFSYLIFVVRELFNLLYSHFINCNSVCFAESALYLISLANMPLSEALCLSNTTTLFNHLILFSTLSRRLSYWPLTLQGEWRQPWPEHFGEVQYNNCSFFICILVGFLKDKVKWLEFNKNLKKKASMSGYSTCSHALATQWAKVLNKLVHLIFWRAPNNYFVLLSQKLWEVPPSTLGIWLFIHG